MSTERDPAALLRDGMTAEARTVTASPAFTEQIISNADRQPHRAPRPGWRGWLLPAAAAAAGGDAGRRGPGRLRADAPRPAATGRADLPSARRPACAPTPSGAALDRAPSPSGATGSSACQPDQRLRAPRPGRRPGAGRLPGGRPDLGQHSRRAGRWAPRPCGQPPCTSIAHTVDGGQSWVGMPAPSRRLGGPTVPVHLHRPPALRHPAGRLRLRQRPLVSDHRRRPELVAPGGPRRTPWRSSTARRSG